MKQKRKPLGPPVERTDADILTLATLTPELVEEVRVWWRENAPPGFEGMLERFAYDPETRRYTAPSRVAPGPAAPRGRIDPRLTDPPRVRPGQVMAPEEVRRVLDYVLDNGEAELVALTEQLNAGQITLARWQLRFERMVAIRALAAAVLAMGGFEAALGVRA